MVAIVQHALLITPGQELECLAQKQVSVVYVPKQGALRPGHPQADSLQFEREKRLVWFAMLIFGVVVYVMNFTHAKATLLGLQTDR